MLLQRVINGIEESVELAPDARIAALNQRIDELENTLDIVDSGHQLPARVVRKTADSFQRSLKINKGSNDGVRENQVVLHDGAMIGVIRSVGPRDATVVLLGDPRVQVPVVVAGYEAIVTAQSGGVVVDKIVTNQTIKAHSPVTTSGLDGLYPSGILVGSLGSELERSVFLRFVLEWDDSLGDLGVVTIWVQS
jgi:rod shape-determining protein MreC